MHKYYFFFSLFSITFLSVIFRANAQFSYVDPLPNSKYHLPKTSIILRVGDLIDANTVHNPNLVEIIGSVSGKHTWTPVLSEGKVLIIKPDQPFSYGETVQVTVHDLLKRRDGSFIKGFSFSFQIMKEITPEQKTQIAQSDRAMNMQEDMVGRDLSRPGKTSSPTIGYLDSMPTFKINVNNNPAPGQIFYDNQSDDDSDTNSFPTIINNDGSIVWAKDAGLNGHDFKINLNGYLSYFDYDSVQWIIMDSNYNHIDSIASVGYGTNAHDMIMFPDKHAFVMGYDNQIIDMSQIVPGGQPNAQVKGLALQELDSNKNVIWQWRSLDYFQITDADSNTSLTNSIVDFEHPNAIEQDNDGNILLSSRNFCEITKIDINTGNIIWRLGGENNQFTFKNDNIPQHFSYQHDIRRIANGDITLFNNGAFLPVQKSSAKEYSLNEKKKIATLVWYYEHPDVDTINVYGRASGSVQRLSNGNTIISWGNIFFDEGIPNMTEVDSNKNIVWEFTFDSALQKSYRVHKYDWDICSRISAFTMRAKPNVTTAKLTWGPATGASKYKIQVRVAGTQGWLKAGKTETTQKRISGLLSSTTYEWRVQSRCVDLGKSGFSAISTFTTLASKEFNDLTTQENVSSLEVYPNPTSNIITISTDALNNSNQAFIIVRNMLGEIVQQQSATSDGHGLNVNLQVESLSRGMYIVEVHAGSQTLVNKFIKE